MADDTDHKDALEAYEVCARAAEDNNRYYEQDYEFALSSSGDDSVQWPASVKAARSVPGQERPMLTHNVLPSFGRQVINEIRQNRPTIKCRPADSGADIETALVMSGLIKNIEYTSNADVAHDTAAECAVYGGFGYYRVDIDYACDDTFDKDIKIARIVNPLCVKGDPYSNEADSSDWNMTFIEQLMTPAAFKEAYPKADPVSFAGDDKNVKRDWNKGDDILVAEYWKRSKEMKTVLLLSNGRVVDAKTFDEVDPDTGLSPRDMLQVEGAIVKGERQIETYVVDQCILNGQEQLTEKIRWVGKYIPIVPVYGEEINLKGKRLFRSMIHRAIDAQRQVNYWETTATELVALAPRVPYIGEEGAFAIDPNWQTANSQNHPYLEYAKGKQPPMRQPLDSGVAVGAMQEAMRANDRLKQILGIYNASLGAESNEKSGVAINARKVEAEVGNYHFSDNLSRAIRHEGRILLDLIPKVYTKGRMVRVMGDDGMTQTIQLGPRQGMAPPPQPGQEPAPPKIGSLQGVFDLTMSKYDITVEAGPSYTTQRQETAQIVSELIRANPAMLEIGGDIMVSNLDLKDGDELARRMKKMLPPQLQDNGEAQIPPQVQQQMQQMEQALAETQEQLEKERSANLKGAGDMAKVKLEGRKLDVEEKKIPVMQLEAQLNIMTAQKELLTAQANLEKVRAEAKLIAEQTSAEIATGQNEQVNAAVPAIMQAIEGVRAEATRPRIKKGRARKMPNGEFELMSIEEMAPQAQGVM